MDQEISLDGSSSCRCSMTSYGDLKNEKERESNAQLVPVFSKRFPARRWSFLGPGSEKKWYSTNIDRPQEGDRVAESMMIRFGESRHPFYRATGPLSRRTLKTKRIGNLSIHFCTDGETVEICFSHISFFEIRSIITVPNVMKAHIPFGKVQFHQNWDEIFTFQQKVFIKNHFLQKPHSSKPFSSKPFSKSNFTQNQFHPLQP